MKREQSHYLRLVTMLPAGRLSMAADAQEARRDASHWYIRLREEDGDPAVKAELDEWLRSDPLHREAWSSMYGTMQTANRAPADWKIPGNAAHRRKSGRDVRGVSVGQRRPTKRIVAGAVAAACAFVLALPTISLNVQADHLTPAGQVERIALADGSVVELGPDSAIAVKYDQQGRTVRLLSGQAMFDVTHDPSKPFRVKAGDVTTTVLGTRFDVRMIGETTSVSVNRGHVRVEDTGATPVGEHDLLVGDWVRIAGDHASKTGKIAPQLIGGWRQGEVLAENRTIESVIDEIRPWYRGRIIVADSKLAARPVTGIYNVRDPEQALSMIITPYGGRITRITPWLMIVMGL